MIGSGLLFAYSTLIVLAAIEDIRRLEIPDFLSIGLLLVGLFAILWEGPGWSVLPQQVLMALAAFGVGWALFAAGVWGGGDVKLLAALFFWLPPGAAYPFVMVMALAGGGVALLVLAGRALARRGALPKAISRLPLFEDTEGVPYGVAIAAAGLLCADRLVPFTPPG